MSYCTAFAAFSPDVNRLHRGCAVSIDVDFPLRTFGEVYSLEPRWSGVPHCRNGPCAGAPHKGLPRQEVLTLYRAVLERPCKRDLIYDVFSAAELLGQTWKADAFETTDASTLSTRQGSMRHTREYTRAIMLTLLP